MLGKEAETKGDGAHVTVAKITPHRSSSWTLSSLLPKAGIRNSLHPHPDPTHRDASMAQLPLPSLEIMLLKTLPFLKNSPLSLLFVPLSLVSKSRTGASHWQSLDNRFVPIVRGAEKVDHY